MKASYKNQEGIAGNFQYPVILSQPMQHKDGFTLLGFNDWEDVNNEKLASAITNLCEFHIAEETIGFKNEDTN